MSKTDKTSLTPPAPNQPDAARRALLRGAIKGAALAPAAIVTLKSGSAWAAANSVPCFNATFDRTKFSVRTAGSSNNQFLQYNGVDMQQSQISLLCWQSGTGQPTGTFQNVTLP